MLKIKNLIIVALLSLLSFQVSAHSNHGAMEPLSEDGIAIRADNIIQNLLAQKRLPESWGRVEDGKVSQQETASGKVWVVQFTKLKAEDKSKQKLYLFLDPMGNVITANYTGKL